MLVYTSWSVECKIDQESVAQALVESEERVMPHNRWDFLMQIFLEAGN